MCVREMSGDSGWGWQGRWSANSRVWCGRGHGFPFGGRLRPGSVKWIVNTLAQPTSTALTLIDSGSAVPAARLKSSLIARGQMPRCSMLAGSPSIV